MLRSARPRGGFRSVPALGDALRLRLRLQTHRRVRQAWGRKVVVDAVTVLTGDRYVFRTRRPDGRQVFVKARRGSTSLVREAEVLRAASAAGVAVADLTDYLPGRPEVLIVSEIAGCSLRDRVDARAWQAAGELLRRFHDTQPPSSLASSSDDGDWGRNCAAVVRTETNRAVAHGLVERGAIEPAASWAGAVLSAMPVPRLGLIHGDCMSKHVLVDGSGEAWLIDFDAAEIGDPLFDLAVLTMFATERLDHLLAGYAMRRTDELERLIGAYRVMRLVKSLNWEAQHGYDSTAILESLPAIARSVSPPI